MSLLFIAHVLSHIFFLSKKKPSCWHHLFWKKSSEQMTVVYYIFCVLDSTHLVFQSQTYEIKSQVSCIRQYRAKKSEAHKTNKYYIMFLCAIYVYLCSHHIDCDCILFFFYRKFNLTQKEQSRGMKLIRKFACGSECVCIIDWCVYNLDRGCFLSEKIWQFCLSIDSIWC